MSKGRNVPDFMGFSKLLYSEELANEYEGRVKVVKVDVDNAQETAQGFGIRSIPTLLIFQDGKVADQLVGAVPKSAIEDKLNTVLS